MRRAVLIALAGALIAAPAAHAQAPWQGAEQIREGLFSAQTDLLLGEGATASGDVARRSGAWPEAKLARLPAHREGSDCLGPPSGRRER
jgi:hypothetical protein